MNIKFILFIFFVYKCMYEVYKHIFLKLQKISLLDLGSWNFL